MSLIENLTEMFSDAFEACALDRDYGQVVVSQRPELGQFQCNGALPAAGRMKKKKKKKVNPRLIAQQVLDALSQPEIFADLSLAGPGFINMTLTDEYLASYIREIASDERLGVAPVANPQRIVLDFGGTNVAKPMHVGHLRASIIGDSLQRILRFAGHDVVSDIHLGDWGTQMGMLIIEVQRRLPDLLYFNGAYTGPYPEESPVTIDDLAEMYPVVSARCKEDEAERERARQATVELQQARPGYRALWQHFVDVSIEALKRDFDNLGVHFDLWYGESSVDPRISPMIERLKSGGYTEMSDGALVISVTQDSDTKEIPPLILVKSNGGVLYGTTDLATIDERVDELNAEQILYVVDARQSLHFLQVFRAAHKGGVAPTNVVLKHLGFGTMNGKDGRPFKTRAGGVMRLSDLMKMMTEAAMRRLNEAGVAQDVEATERAMIAKQVGLAALKYADLSNHRTSDYIFDLERFMAFEGRTGPYLLYSAVRIKSILRKALSRELSAAEILPPTHPAERDLMLKITLLPQVIERTIDTHAPNYLCEHAYNLGLAFNRFYNACHILSEENPAQQASWLALCELSLAQIELIAHLLGLEIPQRM
ncbi:MAG: arginine--tRNA ligase [Ardenticatenaceae bacterium]